MPILVMALFMIYLVLLWLILKYNLLIRSTSNLIIDGSGSLVWWWLPPTLHCWELLLFVIERDSVFSVCLEFLFVVCM
jgi:hypothetical protein